MPMTFSAIGFFARPLPRATLVVATSLTSASGSSGRCCTGGMMRSIKTRSKLPLSERLEFNGNDLVLLHKVPVKVIQTLDLGLEDYRIDNPLAAEAALLPLR